MGVLFAFPSRYWFAIGLTGVFSLAGWARRLQTGFLVSRPTQDTAMPCLASRTGLSPSTGRLSNRFCSQFKCNVAVLQPLHCVATTQVWAVPRSLATTWGITFCFLFLRVLRCFSSPRWPHHWVVIRTSGCVGCPIRASMDQRSFAPPHGFSQLIAPFVASVSLGIHHAPLSTFFVAIVDVAHTFRRNLKFSFKSLTYSLVCQYVKELVSLRRTVWRISDSNR